MRFRLECVGRACRDRPSACACVCACPGIPHGAADTDTAKHAAPDVHLLWHAPFLDASSFGNEATTLVLGLLDAQVVPESQLSIRLLQVSADS